MLTELEVMVLLNFGFLINFPFKRRFYFALQSTRMGKVWQLIIGASYVSLGQAAR